MKQPYAITVNSAAMSVLQTHVINIQPTPRNVTFSDAYANLNSVSSNTSWWRKYIKIPCNTRKYCEACDRIYTVGKRRKNTQVSAYKGVDTAVKT